MKQILLKKGVIYTGDIAAPTVEKGMILVNTAFSCISAGTEMAGVQNSGTPIIKRALESPELMKRGLEMVKERGIKDTLNVVKGKYEVGTQLGYSASGIVEESNSQLFQKGDRVACMGVSYANHAGYIVIPQNLAAKLPQEVSFEEGATAALGCIAMQGVRRADVKIGEYVVVIGLGILGQLTSRLVMSSGATAIVTDVDSRRLEIAKKSGANYAVCASDDVVKHVNEITGGNGADSVIITAASKSNDIISQAFRMCRRRGHVVLVGVTGLDIDRDDMYNKELSFSIATSYGPGRYDPDYEEKGNDYPYAYVRFTEKRNLESYLRLLADKRIAVSDIIEEVYPAEKAADAYNALRAETNRPLIVLLKYSEQEEEAPSRTIQANATYKAPDGAIKIALCGAGGFAKGMHLPNLQRMQDKYSLYAIQSRTGSNAQAIAVKYGAKYSTTDYEHILSDKEVDMVMICTRHDTHADMVVRALNAGKMVFVEKPLALTKEETAMVISIAQETGMPLMVGFNRRFSKHAKAVKELIADRKNPIMVSYRMNAGFIPHDSWIQTSEGGGRIIGEGCHILDLFGYFTESKAESISVTQVTPGTDHVLRTDNAVITVKYEDGSVCSLLYTGQGHKGYTKEHCEVFCDGNVFVIDDYKELRSYGVKAPNLKSAGSEKGQYEELVAFYEAIKAGDGYPIPLWQLEQATLLSIMGQN